MQKENVLKEIARLQAASPDSDFEPLKAAVDAFFTADPELENTVRDTVFQLAFNYEYRNTVYKNPALGPSFSDDFPLGYDDVRVLFDADGVWAEIEATSEFREAMLADWIVRIKAAREGIVPKLQDIIEFCECDATANGLVACFEDPYNSVSTPPRKETAERVYIDGGYMEVIKTYGLDIHIPSYYM